MQINQIAQGLILQENGLWCSDSTRDVSYPERGNEVCFDLEADSFWFTHRNKIIGAALGIFVPPEPFFDIGGGNGYVAQYLQELGHKVVLVEPGSSGALNAKMRGLDNVICSTVQEAGFLPASIPSMGMFDVLEHIEDDEGFLRELHVKLSDDGRLYLTVPAYSFLWSEDDRYAQHYRRYTLKNLCQKLRDTGFNILFNSYFFAPLPLPIFLSRTLPSLFGIRKAGELEDYKEQHSKDSEGFLSRMLFQALNVELRRITSGKTIPFGASCLVVAQKNSTTFDHKKLL